MKKDIFIDTNIASRFVNPMDEEYKRLIRWLLQYHNDTEKDAYLMVSQKLLVEYHRSNRGAHTNTCIFTIIDMLTKQGRLVKVSSQQIEMFKQRYFTKTVLKKFRSNIEDHDHIPVVLLSDRKYALAIDAGFCYDLENFVGFVVNVQKRPELLPYE